MKAAAIYARVSTTDQKLDLQLADLKRLAAQRDFQVVKVYSDAGESGAKSSRPALDRMLKDAAAGRFQVLLIWKLDRLGRSTTHLLTLLEQFKTWNVELLSASEGLDFTTSAGQLFYTLLAGFAQFERDCIRERTRGGLRAAKARGQRLGRPVVPVDIVAIRTRRAAGATWERISQELNVPRSTLQNAVASAQRACAAD